MSRRVAFLATLLAVAILSLPVYAAVQRARAQGLYTYRLTGTESIAGHTRKSQDTGTLTMSSTRIRGQSSDGEATFSLRLTNRITAKILQKTQAQGNLLINDSDGNSKGKLTANVRVQKTRAGIWKVTLNYVGTITQGPYKGGTVTGKMVAKSS